ncbi:MAG: Inner membrane protein translocase and chaperone YidC, long form [Rhodanobacteraceae bacterium]|nr:MAG: Inner membrane protein translocase and chaperone YidC, long form [Rhodanobacteraceae bacterium]
MINQTRTLLVVALLVVAYLLWQGWQHDYPSATPASPPATSAVPASSPGVPEAPGSAAADAATTVTSVPATSGKAAATPAADLITASNDVLRLTIDPRGGTIVGADLLDYPQQVKRGSPPVRLLDDTPANYYVAQSGLVGADGSAAPNHLAEFTATAKENALAPGQKQVVVTLDWRDAATGIGVVKRYTLTRGSYVVGVSQQIDNRGVKAWHGNAYEQLERVQPPPAPKHFLEFYNPDSLSFTGAAWYSPDDKFKKLAFDKFEKDPLNQEVTGGWIAMSQRFFLGAWIPDARQAERFSSVEVAGQGADGKPLYLVREMGPTLSVAPGASATSSANLYVGPKLQNELGDIAPGLNLTVDYGMFTVIAAPMFKLLSWLHALVRDWGLAIIALVLIIQAATWKLTEAQYKSGARMRKLQPRMQALKERFGDDKQKYQQAMMELYKKEKVNPMAGCLPALITMPIFLALYYVLIFSVELRHVPFLWIPDLSAADPYFILPVLYALTMLGTQFLTPMQGMDPTQARMMKVMPVLFSVLFFFFPAGLTLYYVVRGICMLGQQWYITRKIERADARARA